MIDAMVLKNPLSVLESVRFEKIDLHLSRFRVIC